MCGGGSNNAEYVAVGRVGKEEFVERVEQRRCFRGYLAVRLEERDANVVVVVGRAF